MPQAIKAVGFSSTTSGGVTHYTCPATTCAKVLISSFYLTAGTSAGATTLTVGGVQFSATFGTSTSTLSHNDGDAQGDGVAVVADNGAPLEFYLAAAQTVSTNIHTGAGSSAQLQMTVIEEATS